MVIKTAGVQLIAWTHFEPPTGVPWPDTSHEGEELAHFAGRACYQSWERKNPATAGTAGYIDHILDVGHFSVLEHAHASFYFQGISRALTHELIRHRHFSYSQLSQRFVSPDGVEAVVPPLLADVPAARDLIQDIGEYSAEKYAELLEIAETTAAAIPGLSPTARRKAAREAARAALPNATETKIVVTGNIRAWRHFIDLRASDAADREICDLAIQVLLQLQRVYPASFTDYALADGADGRITASSPHAERS